MVTVFHPWEVAAAYLSNYGLPRAGWAWEYLRRHPDYISDYIRFQRRDDAADPSRWGLLLFEDPGRHARDALVFWRADVIPWTVRLKARPAEPGDAILDLWEGTGSRAIAVTQAGAMVLLERGGSVHRLLFRDPGDVTDRIAFDIELPGRAGSLDQVEPARAFLASFLVGQTARNELDPLAPKLARYLQALDGRMAGATYGRIATAIFVGDALLETAAGRRTLKDRTRHAVKRGFALRNGGYRSLLAGALPR